MGMNIAVSMGTPSAVAVPAEGSAAGRQAPDSAFAGLLEQVLLGEAPNEASLAGLPLSGWFVLPLGAAGSGESEPVPAIAPGDLATRLGELLARLDDKPDASAAELVPLLNDLIAALYGALAAGVPQEAAAGDAPQNAQQEPAALTGAADVATEARLLPVLRQMLGQWLEQLAAGEAPRAEWLRSAAELKQALVATMPQADVQPQPGPVPMAKPEPASRSVRGDQPNLPRTTRPEAQRAGLLQAREAWRWQPVANAAQAANPAGTVRPDDPSTPVAGAEPTAVSDLAADSGSLPVWVFRDAAGAVAGQAKADTPAPVPVRQFAEHLEPFIVKKLTLHRLDGVTEARISLHPEHLGHVDIRLTVQNGQLSAQFITGNGMAKELLENQMAQLRAALQGHGLQVDRMEVVQQSPSTSTSAFLQQQDRHARSGDERQGTFRNGRGSAYRDAVEFEAALERTALLHDVYGSSINLTA